MPPVYRAANKRGKFVLWFEAVNVARKQRGETHIVKAEQLRSKALKPESKSSVRGQAVLMGHEIT